MHQKVSMNKKKRIPHPTPIKKNKIKQKRANKNFHNNNLSYQLM